MKSKTKTTSRPAKRQLAGADQCNLRERIASLHGQVIPPFLPVEQPDFALCSKHIKNFAHHQYGRSLPLPRELLAPVF